MELRNGVKYGFAINKDKRKIREMEEDGTIVIDIGGYTTMVGVAGDDAPTEVYSSFINEESGKLIDMTKPETFDMKNVKRIVEKGSFSSHNNYEIVSEQILADILKIKKLNIPNAVVFSLPPMLPRGDLNFLLECYFEKFETPAIGLEASNAFALYSSGRNSGAVLCTGDSYSSTLVIYNGYLIPESYQFSEKSGNFVNNELLKQINEQKEELRYHKRDLDIKKDLPYLYKLKHTYCSVPASEGDLNDRFISNSEKVKYFLPDKTSFYLDSERVTAPGRLFSSTLADNDNFNMINLDEIVVKSIKVCPITTHFDCFNNIIVSGGNSFFHGFVDKLSASVLTQSEAKACKVVAPPERLYSEWIGGSILGSLSSFLPITKADYNEVGPDALFRKEYYGTFYALRRHYLGFGEA